MINLVHVAAVIALINCKLYSNVHNHVRGCILDWQIRKHSKVGNEYDSQKLRNLGRITFPN